MQERIYKYRLKVTKQAELRFISHLDWQGLILKIFRRLELPLVLSQGFNKMPKVAFSPALPIFIESDCEMINFQVQEKFTYSNQKSTERFHERVSKALHITNFPSSDHFFQVAGVKSANTGNSPRRPASISNMSTSLDGIEKMA